MIARECNCSIELGSSGKHMEYCPMHPAYAKREPQRDDVETMTLSDLARRVLLTPDASREQVLDRVDALMKEPRSIAARDTLRAEKAIANQHASNMRLERALDDIATLETRLQESRLVIADQAFMINRMNRKGTK